MKEIFGRNVDKQNRLYVSLRTRKKPMDFPRHIKVEKRGSFWWYSLRCKILILGIFLKKDNSCLEIPKISLACGVALLRGVPITVNRLPLIMSPYSQTFSTGDTLPSACIVNAQWCNFQPKALRVNSSGLRPKLLTTATFLRNLAISSSLLTPWFSYSLDAFLHCGWLQKGNEQNVTQSSPLD